MVSNGVVAEGRGQEIGRDKLCALVNQLIECMLAVCPRLAPDDGAGLVTNPFPPAGK